MLSLKKFMGGSTNESISADMFLTRTSPRVLAITAIGGGKKVRLPDATTLVEGGPHFYVLNTAAQQFKVFLPVPSVINIPVPSGAGYLFVLVDGSTTEGVWRVEGFSVSTGLA